MKLALASAASSASVTSPHFRLYGIRFAHALHPSTRPRASTDSSQSGAVSAPRRAYEQPAAVVVVVVVDVGVGMTSRFWSNWEREFLR